MLARALGRARRQPTRRVDAGRRRGRRDVADRARHSRSTNPIGDAVRSPASSCEQRSPTTPGARRSRADGNRPSPSPSTRRCRRATCIVAWRLTKPTARTDARPTMRLHGHPPTPAATAPAGDHRRRRHDGRDAGRRRQRRRAPVRAPTTWPTRPRCRAAPIWLGRVLSIVGLAVLFGSLVLIVAAWPEGPEYVLAVRFLRSVWIVGAGRHVPLRRRAERRRARATRSAAGSVPARGSTCFDAGWAGRAAVARLVLVVASGWVVLRPERVIDPTTQLPALGIPALAVVTLGLSRTGGGLAFLGVRSASSCTCSRWRSGSVASCCSPGSCSPGPARRTSSTPCAGSAGSPTRRSSPPSSAASSSCPARTAAIAVQRPATAGAAAQDGRRGGDAVRRPDRAPGRPPPSSTGRTSCRSSSADRLRARSAPRPRSASSCSALSGWLLALTPAKVADDCRRLRRPVEPVRRPTHRSSRCGVASARAGSA